MTISVVVPAFNCERYIEEAIRSVMVQVPAVLEIIVIDDGSTDSTGSVARGLDPRVRVIKKENGGPAAARNRGIRESRGDYIAFLDGDDVWLPGRIGAQLKHLDANPGLKFLFGQFELFRRTSTGHFETSPAHYSDPDLWSAGAVTGWIYPELLLDSIVHTITVMMHRSVFERVGGFDETLRTGEDYDYWLRVSREFEMHGIAQSLAKYRLHDEGATRVVHAQSNELMVLLRAIERFGTTGPDGRHVDENALRRRIAKLWFNHGHNHFWNGDISVAATAFGNSFAIQRSGRSAAYWVAASLRSILDRKYLER